MMLKRISLILSILCLPHVAYAVDCSLLNEQAEKDALPVIPRWGLTVKSKQRVYFHSAPIDACKIKDLFIIHDDSVTAYDLYRDKNKQEWVYVIYYSKRQDLENEIVEGWIKHSEFNYLGTDSPMTK